MGEKMPRRFAKTMPMLPAVALGTIVVLSLSSQTAFARRAYFMGSLSYNDSGSDAVNGRGSGWCYGGTNKYSGCYKLYTCNIVVSNLSSNTQSITGYSLTITNFLSSQVQAKSTGVAPDSYSPLILTNSSASSFFGWTTQAVWTAGTAGPNLISRKYQHTADTSSLLPASGQDTGSSKDLSPGETAVLTFGNYGWTMGGVISPSIYGGAPGGANLPFKEVVTCFGFIDVVDTVPTAPGFVVASGAMDSKAGSYFNGAVYYGASVSTAAAYPTTGSGAVHNSGGLYWLDVERTGIGLGTASTQVGDGLTSWGASVGTAWFNNADGVGNRNANDNMFGWVGGVTAGDYSCDIDYQAAAATSLGTTTADWPEITYNSPILINGGTPF